jgi:hypothetical protein
VWKGVGLPSCLNTLERGSRERGAILDHEALWLDRCRARCAHKGTLAALSLVWSVLQGRGPFLGVCSERATPGWGCMEDDAPSVSIQSGTAVAASGALSGSAGDRTSPLCSS